MTNVPANAHPADGSFWAAKPVCSSPFNHIRLVVYCGTISTYDSDGAHHIGYVVHEDTDRKTAMPRFVVSRDRFFDWFEPYVLTDKDRRGR